MESSLGAPVLHCSALGQSTPEQDNAGGTFPFLLLPRELRNRIYSEYFHLTPAFNRIERLNLTRFCSTAPSMLVILGQKSVVLNRQVCAEALEQLFKFHNVTFDCGPRVLYELLSKILTANPTLLHWLRSIELEWTTFPSLTKAGDYRFNEAELDGNDGNIILWGWEQKKQGKNALIDLGQELESVFHLLRSHVHLETITLPLFFSSSEARAPYSVRYASHYCVQVIGRSIALLFSAPTQSATPPFDSGPPLRQVRVCYKPFNTWASLNPPGGPNYLRDLASKETLDWENGADFASSPALMHLSEELHQHRINIANSHLDIKTSLWPWNPDVDGLSGPIGDALWIEFKRNEQKATTPPKRSWRQQRDAADM